MATKTLGALLATGVVCSMAFASQARAITTRPTLDDADVQRIVEAAKAGLAREHANGCIAIADADGVVLFLQRQADAVPNCVTAAMAKVKTASEFHMVTNDYYKQLEQGKLVMLAVPDLAPIPGGVPLYSGKTMVGSVAISTPDGDVDLAVVKDAVAAFNH